MPYFLTGGGWVVELDVPKKPLLRELHDYKVEKGELRPLADEDVQVEVIEVPDARGGAPHTRTVLTYRPAALDNPVDADEAPAAAESDDSGGEGDGDVDPDGDPSTAADGDVDKNALLAELAALGVEVDRRWGVPRLLELLAEHRG